MKELRNDLVHTRKVQENGKVVQEIRRIQKLADDGFFTKRVTDIAVNQGYEVDEHGVVHGGQGNG